MMGRRPLVRLLFLEIDLPARLFPGQTPPSSVCAGCPGDGAPRSPASRSERGGGVEAREVEWSSSSAPLLSLAPPLALSPWREKQISDGSCWPAGTSPSPGGTLLLPPRGVRGPGGFCWGEAPLAVQAVSVWSPNRRAACGPGSLAGPGGCAWARVDPTVRCLFLFRLSLRSFWAACASWALCWLVGFM